MSCGCCASCDVAGGLGSQGSRPSAFPELWAAPFVPRGWLLRTAAPGPCAQADPLLPPATRPRWRVSRRGRLWRRQLLLPCSNRRGQIRSAARVGSVEKSQIFHGCVLRIISGNSVFRGLARGEFFFVLGSSLSSVLYALWSVLCGRELPGGDNSPASRGMWQVEVFYMGMLGPALGVK